MLHAHAPLRFPVLNKVPGLQAHLSPVLFPPDEGQEGSDPIRLFKLAFTDTEEAHPLLSPEWIGRLDKLHFAIKPLYRDEIAHLSAMASGEWQRYVSPDLPTHAKRLYEVALLIRFWDGQMSADLIAEHSGLDALVHEWETTKRDASDTEAPDDVGPLVRDLSETFTTRLAERLKWEDEQPKFLKGYPVPGTEM